MNWCKKNFIEIKYTQPAKQMHNRYIARFNPILEKTYLDAYYFYDAYQLKKISDN